MRRLLTPAIALIAAVALGACGGGDESSDGPRTVSVKQVDGVGSVLVDASGKALYTADVEKDGKVRCEDACTSFWQPLAAPAGDPTADGDVGELGVIERPDGVKQVTVDGKPLYTFSEDKGGKVTGDGFSDDFGKQRFTWQAVRAKGQDATSAPSRGGYGY